MAEATINIAAGREEEKPGLLRLSAGGAVGNPEDALTRCLTDQERLTALREAARTAQNSTQLALSQYRAGFTNYTSVLEAQSQELSARDTMAAAQGQLASDLASLFKALGGGWREDGAAEKALRLSANGDKGDGEK